MNLMIILVPVLLMNMVFSHITVLGLKLPDSASAAQPIKDPKQELLELVIYKESLVINYPTGVALRSLSKIRGKDSGELTHDFVGLSKTLQDLKQEFRNRDIEKRDILILSQPETRYQTIVKAMDTVRSYKAVQVASVVDAELFPVISLGDAPVDAAPKLQSRGAL